MNKFWKTGLAILIVVVLSVTFTACTTAQNGLSAYELAQKYDGFEGTEEEWLASLKQGASAYEVAKANGYPGTEKEWLVSLQGKDGTDGKNGADAAYTISDVYEAYKAAYKEENGTEYTGTFIEFLQTYFEKTYQTVSTETMVAEAVLSCVSIYCNFEITTKTGNPWFGYQTNTSISTSAGSGVIISLDKASGDAYIITNYHVVYNKSGKSKISDDINILLYGYEKVVEKDESGSYKYKYAIPATYIGGSMNYDIAVLYVHDSSVLRQSDARVAQIGDSSEVSIGQDAIAIGNAEAEGMSVTSGIISVDSESLTMTAADDETQVTFRVMRVDTAINEGNSGGGLFDAYGRLIGIVNAKSVSSTVDNIGYAIPVNIAIYTANGIIERFEAAGKTGAYKATKCMLGISVTVSESRSYYDTDTKRVRIEETVIVAEDIAETAAAYGQLQKGDILRSIQVGDTKLTITRQYVVIDAMLLARVGDTITIEYERDGQLGSAVITVNSTTEIDSIG